MSEPHERFRESLRGLAESAAAVPTLALSGLLVGGTALAVAGAFGPEPRRVPPVSGGLPSASAPGTALPASPPPGRVSAPSASASASASAAPSTASGPAGPTAPGRTAPTDPSASGPAVPQLPGTAAACAAVRTGETLVRLDTLQLPTGLTSGVGALLYAVPVSCAHGRPEPGGPAQWLQVAPDAEVTTTAPLSSGTHPTASSLAALATGLTQHPQQLFDIGRDAEGQVTRLDQVFQAP
jgi:hypothetical protein